MAELERPEAIDYLPPESEPLLFGYIIKNLNEHLTTPREDGTPYTGYDQRRDTPPGAHDGSGRDGSAIATPPAPR
jgi:hypothetical protein